MTTVPNSQIAVKKKIGRVGGKSIDLVRLVGGYNMIVDSDGSILGAGPHRRVAMHIAKNFNPNIEYSELSKSDHIPYESFEHLIPQCEELTKALQQAQNDIRKVKE